jgi:hypothetical protein
MRSNRVRLVMVLAFTLVVAVAVRAQQQRQPPDPAKALTNQLTSITKQVLEMAEDFPAEKYEFKATTRSPVVPRGHRACDVGDAVRRQSRPRRERAVGRNWTRKNYKDKAGRCGGVQEDLGGPRRLVEGDARHAFAASPQPWLAVVEHTGEHYGQLVVYYRLNKMVPPASRPKK